MAQTSDSDWLEVMRQKACAPVRRRPRHDEDTLQTACRQWFDMQHRNFSLLLHHSPNEGLLVRRAADGAKRKAMGVRAGFPDFIFLLPTKAAPYLCIELKTTKGKQSDSQKEYQRMVESVGGKYVVIRSLEEFINTVNDYISNI